jgi:putative hydrolase of the HAD superfamily
VKHIRAVLFDAGGTLIHLDGERASRAASVPYDAAAFRRAHDAALGDVRRWVLANPQSKDAERLPLFLGTIFARLGVPDSERRRAVGAIAAEHGRANLWSRGAEDAPETLEALRGRGYRLAVVSNADGRVRALLKTAGLAEYFEFVVDSSEVGFEKPDPRIFHAATGRLDLPPTACAYVGDIYEIDVLGARGAGLEAILIGNGEAPEDVRRIASLAALLELFSGKGIGATCSSGTPSPGGRGAGRGAPATSRSRGSARR